MPLSSSWLLAQPVRLKAGGTITSVEDQNCEKKCFQTALRKESHYVGKNSQLSSSLMLNPFNVTTLPIIKKKSFYMNKKIVFQNILLKNVKERCFYVQRKLNIKMNITSCNRNYFVSTNVLSNILTYFLKYFYVFSVFLIWDYGKFSQNVTWIGKPYLRDEMS